LEGEDSSSRISTLSSVPTTPERAPKRKYSVPISLWFVEKNQRVTKVENVFLSVLSDVAVVVEFSTAVLRGAKTNIGSTPRSSGEVRRSAG